MTQVAIGTELAGYRIESEIARGGMGVVYRATELALERQVALKLIAPQLADVPSFRERFLRESRLAASIDHPSILPVYAAGEAEGRLYLVTRYVEGTDLRAMLARGQTLDPARAIAIAGHVASALDAAHRRGLVHHDVKPGNVLLDGDDHCYLCDFGLTRELGVTTTAVSGPLAGSLDYLAPEQIRREEVDGRADQYALACVLYECLAGTPPFRRSTPAETLWAHMQEEPAPLPAYPRLDAVLARALAKDPAKRYPSCSGFVEDARAALGLEPSPGAVRQRRVQIGRKLVAAGAALVAAAIVAATALALTRDGDRRIVLPSSSVAAIDPDTGKVVTAFQMQETRGVVEGGPVRSEPLGVTASADWIWVLGVRGGSAFTISRIDARTKRIVREFSITGTPTQLLAAAGALWVRTEQRQIVRISASSDSETGRWTLPRSEEAIREADRPPFGAGDEGSLAYDGNAVWAASPGTISRIDPPTSRIASTASSTWGRLAAGFGSLWTFGDDGVYRLGPRTLDLQARVLQARVHGNLNRYQADILVGEGRVWLVSAPDGRVWQFDPARNGIDSVYDVAGRITAAAIGSGAAWVGTDNGEVVRIDPETRETERIPVGGVPFGMAVGGGLVWLVVR